MRTSGSHTWLDRPTSSLDTALLEAYKLSLLSVTQETREDWKYGLKARDPKNDFSRLVSGSE